MNIPKTILNHPAVLECNDFTYESLGQYKYEIVLRDGWMFENGRNAGGIFYNANSVADFRYASPIKKS